MPTKKDLDERIDAVIDMFDNVIDDVTEELNNRIDNWTQVLTNLTKLVDNAAPLLAFNELALKVGKLADEVASIDEVVTDLALADAPEDTGSAIDVIDKFTDYLDDRIDNLNLRHGLTSAVADMASERLDKLIQRVSDLELLDKEASGSINDLIDRVTKFERRCFDAAFDQAADDKGFHIKSEDDGA